MYKLQAKKILKNHINFNFKLKKFRIKIKLSKKFIEC